MKKIFVQQNHKYITVDTLENEYSEHGSMYDVMQKVFSLKDNFSLIIMDIDKGLYNAACEEWTLNKNFYRHLYNVMSIDEIKEMRKTYFTLSGYWKANKQ